MDENVEPIDSGYACEVVAICLNVQVTRALEIAATFLRGERLVAVGGLFPIFCPERFEEVMDVLFVGDPWPRFCRDRPEGHTSFPIDVQEQNKVQLTHALPRDDRLSMARFLFQSAQTTRGCPLSESWTAFFLSNSRDGGAN